jgi:aldose 1-epimerase
MPGLPNHNLELRAGALRLAVRPDLGGSIAGLWHGDTPVMRSTEPSTLDTSHKSACYPLVPYSNRIGERQFHWQGRPYTTANNFSGSPHSLHGAAWLRAWEVLSSGHAELALRYQHQPDEHWPFAFEVSQHFSLTPQQLDVRLVFTNTADIAQPVGLGWHPYFPKRAGSHLHAVVSERWDSGANQLPIHKVPQHGIDDKVSQLAFDNCFEGWTGPAHIRDESFSLQLTSSLRYLVVYTPHDRDYFCVEPVSHVNNAIQMADLVRHGLLTIQPGQSTDAWMKLDISAL